MKINDLHVIHEKEALLDFDQNKRKKCNNSLLGLVLNLDSKMTSNFF
jgi:hypothetical protein